MPQPPHVPPPRPPFERELRARLRPLLARAAGERRSGEPRPLVVGVSGGPDSTALLLGLAALRAELGLELVVAHLHHGLRASADGDAQFARELATRLECRFETARAQDLAARARGRGIEAAARQARYAFLQETAERLGAGLVLVAHTRDDQAETVLLRALRGAGLRGLAGMPRVRRIAPGSAVRLARPLLDLSRAAVVDYLEARGVVAREDETNHDPRFARTRVRGSLLPLAKELLNPRADEALANVARVARAGSRVVEREARRLLARAARPGCGRAALDGDETGALDRATLAAASPEVLEAALARVLERALGPRLARVHVAAVARLARGGRGTVALPEGLAAWVSGDGRGEPERLRVGAREQAPAPGLADSSAPSLSLPIPGRATDEGSGYVIEARLERAGASPLERDEPLVARLDRARVQGSLGVRRRRAGDRFLPLGASGTTTLKRFFIDRKIPRAERSRVPIVTLEGLPIWVVGERIDDRVKVTAATREVLVLSASRVSGCDSARRTS